MRIDILTLFPDMCLGVLGESIIGRARENGCVEINCRNIRDYTEDKHNRVDDAPYGGGTGMIMQTQPIYDCFMSLCDELGKRPHLIYMSPQGKTLTQERVKELSQLDNVALLCGHYEGVDQRVIDEIVDEEISIGDYVLTGGELPAMVIIDCVSRFIPGVLGSAESAEDESFSDGLLEYPQYTRPAVFRDMAVPEVLLNGNHALIAKWRRERSIEATYKTRPELIDEKKLGKKEKIFLQSLKNQDEQA